MFNLTDSTLTNNTRRALLLITKTITNLSNGVLFGAKEPFMIPMNEFIEVFLYIFFLLFIIINLLFLFL